MGTGGMGGAGGLGGTGIDCTPLENTAAEIGEMAVNQDPPMPTGGAIVDGTYELIARTIYTGPTGRSGKTGNTWRETVDFRAINPGTLYMMKSAVSLNGAADSKVFLAATVKGTKLDCRRVCGGTGAIQFGFDATPTGIAGHSTTPTGEYVVVTFTKT